MKSLPLIALLLPVAVFAADADYTLVIKDHHFQPAELAVPAGKKIKLQVENRDPSPEEFESRPPNREKVIAGNSRITIYIGPLDAGRYPFLATSTRPPRKA